MHACSGSAVARSRSFCANVGRKKRKVYNLTSDDGATYRNGMCKRKRVGLSLRWSPASSGATCFIVDRSGSPVGTHLGWTAGVNDMGIKCDAVKNDRYVSCGLDGDAVAGAAEAMALEGQRSRSETRRYHTHDTTGSCVTVHSPVPTFSDTTYTIDTVCDVHSRPTHHVSMLSNDSSKVSVTAESSPESRQHYGVDDDSIIVRNMKRTPSLSDYMNPSSSNTHPQMDVVVCEGATHRSDGTNYLVSNTLFADVPDYKLDRDPCFGSAKSEPLFARDWETVAKELNKVAINHTYLITDGAPEYSDGDIKYVDMSDYIRITRGSIDNSCRTPESGLPVDGVLMAWDTDVSSPNLRSAVEESDASDGRRVVDDSIVEERGGNLEMSALVVRDSSVGVDAGSDVGVDSLPDVSNEDSRNKPAVTSSLLVPHSCASDRVTHVSHEDSQDLGSISWKRWDFTPHWGRKQVFDSSFEDAWTRGAATQSVESVDILIGDSVVVSGRVIDDKPPVVADEMKLVDEYCPAAGDGCVSLLQRRHAFLGVLQLGLLSVPEALANRANSHSTGQMDSKIVLTPPKVKMDSKIVLTPPKVKIFRKGLSKVVPVTVNSPRVDNPLFRSTPIGGGDDERGLESGRSWLDVCEPTPSGSVSPFSDHGPFWSSPSLTPDVSPPPPPPSPICPKGLWELAADSVAVEDKTEPTVRGKVALPNPHSIGDEASMPCLSPLVEKVPVLDSSSVTYEASVCGPSPLDPAECPKETDLDVDTVMALDESRNYTFSPCLFPPEHRSEYSSCVTKNTDVRPEIGDDTCVVPHYSVAVTREGTSVRDDSVTASEEVPNSGLEARVRLSRKVDSAFCMVSARPVGTDSSDSRHVPDGDCDILQLSLPPAVHDTSELRWESDRKHCFIVDRLTISGSGEMLGIERPRIDVTTHVVADVHNLTVSSVECNKNENNVGNAGEDIRDIHHAFTRTACQGRGGKGRSVSGGAEELSGATDHSGNRRSSVSKFASRIIRRLSNRDRRSQSTHMPMTGAVISTRRGMESVYECPQTNIECRHMEESFQSPPLRFTSPTPQYGEEQSGTCVDIPMVSNVNDKISREVSRGQACCQDDAKTVEQRPHEAKHTSPIVTYIQHLKKRGRIPPSIRNMMRKYSIFGEARRSRTKESPRQRRDKIPGATCLAGLPPSCDVAGGSRSGPVEHDNAVRQSVDDTSALTAPPGVETPAPQQMMPLARRVSFKDRLKKRFRRRTSSPNSTKDVSPADGCLAGHATGGGANQKLSDPADGGLAGHATEGGANQKLSDCKQRKSSVWRRISCVLTRHNSNRGKSDSVLEQRGFVDVNVTEENRRMVGGYGEAKEINKGVENLRLQDVAVTVTADVTFDDFWRREKEGVGNERAVLAEKRTDDDHTHMLSKVTGCEDLVTLYSLGHARKWPSMPSDSRRHGVAVYPLQGISPPRPYHGQSKPTMAQPSAPNEAMGGLAIGDRVVGRDKGQWAAGKFVQPAASVTEDQSPEIVVKDDYLDVLPPGPAIVVHDNYSPIRLSSMSSMNMFASPPNSSMSRVGSKCRTPVLQDWENALERMSRVGSSVRCRSPVLQDWESARESSSNITVFSSQSFSSVGVDYDTARSTDVYYTPVSFLDVRSSDNRSSSSENYYSPRSDNYYSPRSLNYSSPWPFFLPDIGRMSSSFVEPQLIVVDACSSSDDEGSCADRFVSCAVSTPSRHSPSDSLKTLEGDDGVATGGGGYFRPIFAGVSSILSSGYEYLMTDGSDNIGSSYSERFASLFGPKTIDADNVISHEGPLPTSDVADIKRCDDGGSNDMLSVKVSDVPEANTPKRDETNTARCDSNSVPVEPLDRSRHVSDVPSDDTTTVVSDDTTTELDVSSLSLSSRSSSIPVQSTPSSSSSRGCYSDSTTSTGNSEQFRTLLTSTSRNASMYYSIVSADLTPSEEETQQSVASPDDDTHDVICSDTLT